MPSKPPAIFIASSVALHHFAGSTSLPSGCGARPSRISSPLIASRITTFTDCVEVSIPATNRGFSLNFALQSLGDDLTTSWWRVDFSNRN